LSKRGNPSKRAPIAAAPAAPAAAALPTGLGLALSRGRIKIDQQRRSNDKGADDDKQFRHGGASFRANPSIFIAVRRQIVARAPTAISAICTVNHAVRYPTTPTCIR
jgi:hypothetical protein